MCKDLPTDMASRDGYVEGMHCTFSLCSEFFLLSFLVQRVFNGDGICNTPPMKRTPKRSRLLQGLSTWVELNQPIYVQDSKEDDPYEATEEFFGLLHHTLTAQALQQDNERGLAREERG